MKANKEDICLGNIDVKVWRCSECDRHCISVVTIDCNRDKDFAPSDCVCKDGKAVWYRI